MKLTILYKISIVSALIVLLSLSSCTSHSVSDSGNSISRNEDKNYKTQSTKNQIGQGFKINSNSRF